MNNIQLINDEISETIKNMNYTSIVGEIIETKISSNHHYITLKHNDYIIKCNSWGKTYNVKNGNTVKITGFMAFMNKSFTLYYNIKGLDNIGAKLSEYDLLKLKLIDEKMIGNAKKILKKFPYNLGLITANNSAVIRDMMSIFVEKKFVGNIILKNSIMQGDSCPSSIINAIHYFNQIEYIDLVIIFRGGGSSDDLEAFNNYNIMQNIHNSNKIIYCAIGHASDVTQLINFVCDKTFGTPSMVSNYIIEEQTKYYDFVTNIKEKINMQIEKYNECLNKFNKININEVISKFDNLEIDNNINMFNTMYNNILIKFEKCKNIFNEKSKILSPRLYKNDKPIITYDDFNTGAKKLKISFFENDVELYYKIIEK